MRQAAVVFVHGLFSSPATWSPLQQELSAVPAVADQFDFLFFEYATRPVTWNPLRRMPDLDTVAESLRGFIGDLTAEYERIVLVTHSQGGLVAQRFLSRMLQGSRGRELAKIRRLVMFACPNNGSDLFLLARKGLIPVTRNVQERELKPLQTSVLETQRRVLDGIVRAFDVARDRCPIPIVAYAGESDNVVVPSSAAGFFPETGVLPGDHFSVIQPNGPDSRLIHAVCRELARALAEPFPGEPQSEADVPHHRRPVPVAADVPTELEVVGPIPVPAGGAAGPATEFFVHCGPVEQLRNVDIVVSSENTHLQLSQFFKPSTSGSLRWAAAEKSASGQILEDVAGEHLSAWLRNHGSYGLPVPEGTVAPTPSGALRRRNIQRIYHAAITTPMSGTNSYRIAPQAIPRAVHNTFDLARREREELRAPLSSICFPLFGSGRGGMSAVESFELIWESMMSELADDPSWSIHFMSRRRSHFDLLYGRIQAKKRACP
ncbi:alpha/beta fold hydrolase [Streptomyces sp. A7024]|uniref:Alpha/beta fold hydrolase n=1 Tax=Streptomyces coryli TaxID=1128680 RepID=A0A6G4U378_9ACTN|nr:alpha/beta fold hydrolase [Streptomyces coryli]NGN65747.1 alpha/beta fold hydrolase [Streptomyces coryli]